MAKTLQNITVSFPFSNENGQVTRKFEHMGAIQFLPEGIALIQSAVGNPVFIFKISDGVLVDVEPSSVIMPEPLSVVG